MTKLNGIAKAAAGKFMAWPMPKGFYPDGHISFDREKAQQPHSWPTGTNLLTHEQATAMFAHCLADVLAQQDGPFAEFQKHGWKKECEDTDKLLAHLGLDPDACRTDGGWLNLPRIKETLNLPRIKQALAQQGEQQPVCAFCGIPAGGVHMSTCQSGKWPLRVSNGDAAAPAAQPLIPSNSAELKPLRTKTLDKSKWHHDLKPGAVMGNLSEPVDESVLLPQARPLTDVAIDAISRHKFGTDKGVSIKQYRAFARAIEAAHGITKEGWVEP